MNITSRDNDYILMMIAILYEIKPKNPLTLIRKTQAVQKRAILLPPLYSSRALREQKG